MLLLVIVDGAKRARVELLVAVADDADDNILSVILIPSRAATALASIQCLFMTPYAVCVKRVSSSLYILMSHDVEQLCRGGEW